VLSALTFSLLLIQLNDVHMEARSQMARKSTNEASIPNPALALFGKLVGEWTTVGTHGLVPDTTYHGHTTFEWLEGGAFLIMHSEIDEPDIPSAVAVIGSDDSAGDYSMLYFDERGVSRKFEVTLSNNTLTWLRKFPGFSQRVTLTIADDGRTIVSKGALSKDDVSWEKDLDLTYTRKTE
jgi:hypothetical protein